MDKPAMFDVFVHVNGKFIKVLKKGEMPEEDRIMRYIKDRDDTLYIESQELEYFLDEKFWVIFDRIGKSEDIVDRVKAFARCLELCYFDVRLVRVHPDKIMRLAMVVDEAFPLFNDHFAMKDALAVIHREVRSPISLRAVFSATVLLGIVLSQGKVTDRTFRSIYMGALLRDIGLPMIDNKDPHCIDNFPSDETEAEFKQHPRVAFEKFKDFDINDDIFESLITQHHEEPLGTGFPNSLKRAQIYQPAQYLQIIDWLITKVEVAQLLDHAGRINGKAALNILNSSLPEHSRRFLPLLNDILKITFQVSHKLHTVEKSA